MNIQEYIDKLKLIEESLLKFIDDDEQDEENYGNLYSILINQKVNTNQDELKIFLYSLDIISKYHYRSRNFFSKIEKLIKIFKNEITEFFSNWTIFRIFKDNKRLLLFLFNEKIINIDEKVYNEMIKQKYKVYNYIEYFSPEIDSILGKESPIQNINEFNEKRKKGENDNSLYKIIQQDSIEEFIIYADKNDLKLDNYIEKSVFETNFFLMNQVLSRTTLIEYAAFYGSVQIFKYLYKNGVSLTPSLWKYAVHSNNPELFALLEENRDEIYGYQKKVSYEEYFYESIKCHHNDVTNYIRYNYLENLNQNQQFIANIYTTCFSYYNFSCFSDFSDVNNFSSIILPLLGKYDYYTLIELFLTKYEIDMQVLKKALCIAAKKDYGNIAHLLLSERFDQIDSFCFHNFIKLTKIIIPKNITKIENNAFENCISLSEVTFETPSSLTSIEKYAFKNCKSLKEITIPPSVTSIKFGAFSNCSLGQISIPSSVTLIGDYAFNECSPLKEITIPSSIKSINNYVFNECISLKQISIPSTITMIGSFSFAKSLLTQITIPSSLTCIREGAFYNCSLLEKLTIPSSVKSIGNYAFCGCSSLKQISFDFPSSVTSIGEGVFNECSSLYQISIPSSVTKIGNEAFSECYSLTQILFELPSSVNSIGDLAFCGCLSLTQISIPPSVISIADDAFEKCPSLKQI